MAQSLLCNPEANQYQARLWLKKAIVQGHELALDKFRIITSAPSSSTTRSSSASVSEGGEQIKAEAKEADNQTLSLML